MTSYNLYVCVSVSLSLCRHFREISSVFLVLLPELCFMLCLFGYLIFMVIFKWVAYGPMHSNTAPSILIHFIDMFLFTENNGNQELYGGQVCEMSFLIMLSLNNEHDRQYEMDTFFGRQNGNIKYLRIYRYTE